MPVALYCLPIVKMIKAESSGVASYIQREFFIECIPPRATHQSSNQILKTRSGRYFVGKTKKGKAVEDELITLFSLFRPPEPYDKPIALFIRWHFPWRKSEPKKNRILGALPVTTRPDIDNLAKGAIDACCKAGVIKEDSLIYDLNISKLWSDKSGIEVKIKVLDIDLKKGEGSIVKEWAWK